MNTIHFSQRHELEPGKFVIPFSCSDITDLGIDTLVPSRVRTETANKVLGIIRDRITLALQTRGYELEMVNYSSMSITVTKKD